MGISRILDQAQVVEFGRAVLIVNVVEALIYIDKKDEKQV